MFFKNKREKFIDKVMLPLLLDVIDGRLTKEELKEVFTSGRAIYSKGQDGSDRNVNENTYNMIASNPIVLKNNLSEDDIENIYLCVWLSVPIKEGGAALYNFNGESTLNFIKANFYDSLLGFKERNIVEEVTDDFGYDINNPIKSAGIPMNEIYLRSLTTENNGPIMWYRVGSVSPEGSHDIIDHYKVKKLENGQEVDLYIFPYCSYTSTIAPKGFKIIK